MRQDLKPFQCEKCLTIVWGPPSEMRACPFCKDGRCLPVKDLEEAIRKRDEERRR